MLLQKLSLWFRRAYRFGWQQKGLWLRALLCWVVGLFFILVDREPYYDLRQKIRGPQQFDAQIAILHISYDEWSELLTLQPDRMSLLENASHISDSYYWEGKAWETLLHHILKEDPIAIGVSPYFGNNIPMPSPLIINSPIFKNKRVIWSVQLDDEGRLLPSRFTKSYSGTAGLNEHIRDRDGVYRRFLAARNNIPHFAIQIEKRMNSNLESSLPVNDSPQIINFRGPEGTFDQIRLKDLLNSNYPRGFFKNKIVLIGTKDVDGIYYRTPVGNMSRVELTANIVDNIHNKRWITIPHLIWIATILFIFVLMSAWITSNYPQILALFLIFFLNFFYTAFSLWVFDTYFIWTPVLATVIVSMVTYITFLSFQLTLKEYLNQQLENERQFLLEIEELKNNFLSLISHDLKTPIAKIQAICDRLMNQYPQQEFTPDLLSLREVASELHRYIKTILQITRVESRDFRITKDAADINEIIQAVVVQLEPLAKVKRITLTCELEPMFLIEVDQLLIHEVILNLVENAIKYSPEGQTVKVSSQEVDDRVLIMVEDFGPGISEEEQKRIFEKFFRGELGKSQPKGSGLGLYLVKYFVELHNGKVLLESHPKKGTKVGFTLPLIESREDQDLLAEKPNSPNGDTSHEV